MCKKGDIILIKSYIGDDGKKISQHSFIVLEDVAGKIKGLKFDFINVVMSSFKNEEQREKKLSYKENFLIDLEDVIIAEDKDNKRDGYVKSD